MTDVSERLKELRRNMIRTNYFVAFSKLVKSMDDLIEVLPDHLEYLIDLEKRGILFASGPFLDKNYQIQGDGMSIYRADSFEEVETFAKNDPFFKAGIRTFGLREWQVNEGSYTVTVRYSDSTFDIDPRVG
ncbi:MAG: YciI family protein [Chloroflexota bacterium]